MGSEMCIRDSFFESLNQLLKVFRAVKSISMAREGIEHFGFGVETELYAGRIFRPGPRPTGFGPLALIFGPHTIPNCIHGLLRA